MKNKRKYILTCTLFAIIAFIDVFAAPKKSTFLELAKKLYDNGDYKQAIEFIDKAIDKDTLNKFQAFNLRGICNYNLKNFQDALKDLNLSLELINTKISQSNNPDLVKDINSLKSNTYFNRALVYQELNQLDSALNDYSYVISNDKDNKFSYFNKGFIYYQKSMNDSALFYFSEVLRADPNDLDALYNRANIYYESGDCKLSEIDYFKLIKNKKEDEFIYLNLGNCYFKSSDFAKSIEYYSKSISKNKNMISAYYNRAQSFKSIKNYKFALVDLKFVLNNLEKDVNFVNKKESIIKELENLQNFIKDN